MFSAEGTLNTSLKPTQVINSYWPYEIQERIAQNYPWSDGKWMQFYHKSQLNTVWDVAKAKYQAGILEGIHSMKVSTACINSRASDSNNGVIIFYCGPSDDEAKMKKIGEKLLQEMSYKSSSGFMYYKSDAQTSAGTANTGQQKNHQYRLPCPKNWT